MKRFVVQTCSGRVGQFDSLDIARRHARLNGGGTIWPGHACSTIGEHGAITLERGTKPVEIVW